MNPPERSPIQALHEVVDLCGNREPYSMWARLHRKSGRIQFAEAIGYSDGTSEIRAAGAGGNGVLMNAHWKLWDDQQSYSLAREASTSPPESAPPLEDEKQQYAQLNIPRVVSMFACRFACPEDLRTGASVLVNWLDSPRGALSSSEKTSLDQAVANTIIRWVQLDEAPASELAQEMVCAESDANRRIRVATTNVLGKLLIKAKTGSYGDRVVSALDDEQVVTAIEDVDTVLPLDESFWFDFGVQAGGGIHRPAFLPLLHQKLANAEQLRKRRGQYDVQLLSRAYITQVLHAHRDNNDRHGPNVTKLLETVRPQRGSHRAVDLSSLVGVSNHIARSMNQRLAPEDRDEQMQAALRPADLAHVSDAFLRVLQITRRHDIPPRLQARQFEEDVYHAEVVALLREGLSSPARIAGHARLSRAPQAAALQEHLSAGLSFSQALEATRQGL